MENMKNMCACSHHKVMPILVILFGLTFLLGALGILTSGFVNIAWPVIVIAGGLMKWISKSGMCKCC